MTLSVVMLHSKIGEHSQALRLLPQTTLDISVGVASTDANAVSGWTLINATVSNPGGFQNTGVNVSVVPEPSTSTHCSDLLHSFS